MKSADRMMLRIQKQEQVLAWVGEQLPKDQIGTLAEPSDNSNSPYMIE